MSLFENLIGKKITAVWVMPGEEYLRIDANGETFIYATGSDCCSETWFAEIIGFDALLDETVTASESLDMPDRKDDGRSRQDDDQFYGQQITTSKGRCQIIYRNSSNGYYGGDAGLIPVCHHKGTWISITADWTAYTS
jgi:hypothetical protein